MGSSSDQGWPRPVRRVVIKIGSGVVTVKDGPGLQIDRNVIFRTAVELAALVQGGMEVIVVSSGAVALGLEELALPAKPDVMSQVQATAAVGQSLLMQLWREAFGRARIRVGQVLLTHSDLSDRQRFLNVRATLDSLIAFGCVPVVNENDTVMTDEITVGDNDTLASQVAKLVGGDALMLLSTVDGLLDADGAVVPLVRLADDPLALVSAAMSATGRGGMGSKVQAARAAAHGGIATFIASGKKRGVIPAALAGETVGTRFEHDERGLPSRKHWIAYTLKSKGAVTVDAGAARAVVQAGASLLPIGMTAVSGQFEAGDLVKVLDPEGVEVARGLSKHSAVDLAAMVGKRGPPVIHRDDLVTR